MTPTISTNAGLAELERLEKAATPGPAAVAKQMVEYGLKGGFIVRHLDGHAATSEETDGYGYPRLLVFDCYDDAVDFAMRA